jgi:hypothetical protein
MQLDDEWLAHYWWHDFAEAWRLIALAEEQWHTLYKPFLKK